MHNRVRMIVASFLVKDLHLEWQRGARHFMQCLVDGDLASNKHGWQWVAGTGTDAAPYFRVFNPTTQGGKFDPDGDYVRRWVPELRDVARPARARAVARARTASPAGYPEPIVDHAPRAQGGPGRGYQEVPAPVPEGHTLFRLAREQSSLFAGRPVHVTSPQGRFAAGAALLDGRVLEEVFSYGKHLFARFGGDTLHVHLGLYGKFTGGTGHAAARRAARCGCAGRAPVRTAPACDRPARPHRLRGARRAGGRARSSPGSAPTRCGRGPTRWPRTARIARSRTAIGALLMDQTVLAGVGNVYRAELLFRHGVSPFRPGRGVDGDIWGADVGGPGRADAGRRPAGPDRDHPARGPVPPPRRRPGGRTPTTSTGAPGCPAGCAAPRCAPR